MLNSTNSGPGIKEIYAPIESDLVDFQKLLQKTLASDDKLIEDIHQHLLKMTGKFLRPALTIFSAKLKNTANLEKALKLATVMELLHTATLIHDDIIDNSELRRNQPSIYFKWGQEISIVSGDYLYAKAFVLLAELKDVWLNEALAQCAHVMCEGEMKQIEKRRDFLMSEEQYFKIIFKKTAILFQAACMGGAYFTGLDKKQIERLGRYGYSLGMAFQIVDDCLDLIGDTESLGKTVGLDIYKNDVTLPVLYLFQAIDAGERAALLAAMQKGEAGLFDKIKKRAVETGVLDKAAARARQYVDEAIDSLEGIPCPSGRRAASGCRESLVLLAKHCIDRVR